MRRNAIVEIFQEVGLSRTIVTIYPNAHMVVGLVILDGIQDAEKAIDNLVGEDILLNLDAFGLRVELGCTHSRIDRPVYRLAI